jgi:CDP-6-deoxy-D-xylo-4-hexulose-3-dehydrase
MTKVSYAQTVYGQEEIDAVVSCLKNSTQMGENHPYSKKISLSCLQKNMDYL